MFGTNENKKTPKYLQIIRLDAIYKESSNEKERK